MDVKYKLADLYKRELFLKYFNSTDEISILKKITQDSLLSNNSIFDIYNAINNFLRFTNTTFAFSKEITLNDIKKLRNELIEKISFSLIDFIIGYCEDNKISYSKLDDVLIINGDIYSQGNHLFYNVFEISEKLTACKKDNINYYSQY